MSKIAQEGESFVMVFGTAEGCPFVRLVDALKFLVTNRLHVRMAKTNAVEMAYTILRACDITSAVPPEGKAE